MNTTFKSLLITSIFALPCAFGASVPTVLPEAATHQDISTNLTTSVVAPSILQEDVRISYILDRMTKRESIVGSDVYPFFPKDHKRHRQWRNIESIINQGLGAASVEGADLNSILSEMFNSIVPASIKLTVDHMKRIPNEAGNNVYRYDFDIVNKTLCWIMIVLKNEDLISEMSKIVTIFTRAIDPWFGSKEFINAIRQDKLSETSLPEKLFAFLEQRRIERQEESNFTLEDCVRLIAIINQ